MADSLYVNSQVEICSIGTEEEDALLVSDTEEETGKKNHSINHNEVEDGEIVDSDYKDQSDDSNTCSFVPINNEKSDLEIPSHFSTRSKVTNRDFTAVKSSFNQSNQSDSFCDSSTYSYSHHSKSSHFRRSKISERNYFRSEKCSPYDKLQNTNHLSRHSDYLHEPETRQLTLSSSRSTTSSMSHLLKNFNKVTLTKTNNQTYNTSKIFSKPVLKLSENLIPITKDDNEISIIGEFKNKTTYKSKDIKIHQRTFNDVLKEGEKKVDNACTKLNNLHISDNPEKYVNNIFAKSKPNLCENLIRQIDSVNKEKCSKTNFKNIREWLDRCAKNNNDNVNCMRNTPIIEEKSDDDNESKLSITIDDIECENLMRPSRKALMNRKSRRNAFSTYPWSRITTPIRNRKVRIIFGGIFTLLDKHRIYDLCLESSRYVEDYEIDMERGEAIVICRSTDSAIKFISQRPSDCMKRYKIMNVAEIANYDLSATI